MRLISFSVENYKSFRTRQDVFFNSDEKNVTAFLGPNSAGKSNFFKALSFYCDFILHSTNFHRGKVLERDYFKYTERESQLPTFFLAEFSDDKYQYEYGFSISRDGDVSSEKLRRKVASAPSAYETIFSRNSMINNRFEDFDFSSKTLRETRSDSLVLTRAFAANNPIAKDVFACIEKIMPFSMYTFMGYTAEKVAENSNLKKQVLGFLKTANLYIQDFSVQLNKDYDKILGSNNPFNDDMLKLLRRNSYEVMTTHIVRDDDGRAVGVREMSLRDDESSGTQQMFAYACPVIEALETGKVLYIDELEVNLHPRECAFIVNLFNEKFGHNKAKGQLIINTHETMLMDLVGKNNVYLLGKDKYEATRIDGLSGIRSSDNNIAKKYNAGMFGAVPEVTF